MALLLSLPLWIVADLRQPLGTGDKRLLREVARKLGIQGAAALPKRAIQVWSAFKLAWSAFTLDATKLVGLLAGPGRHDWQISLRSSGNGFSISSALINLCNNVKVSESLSRETHQERRTSCKSQGTCRATCQSLRRAIAV